MKGKKKEPSLVLSAIPIVILMTLLFLIYKELGSDVIRSASQVVLLFATIVTAALSMFSAGRNGSR